MSDIAIKVENISKRYRIGLKEELHDTFFGALASWVKYPLSNFRRVQKLSKFTEDVDSEDIIWALRDASFDVKHGEVLGIIGRNGAGKSTLLKILCRITEPTNGNASIHGHVASLLEVGTGFHPELTGRENVFLNGTILGMKKTEIESKFDEIVAFSGVEKFIDTPVKRYSSGMRVRLAFAVAAHLEPEILLIDEVLAVGDVGFQKKCLGKMKDISDEGRTVLFVSHNMGAIRSLCSRSILIHEGRIVADGSTSNVITGYHNLLKNFTMDSTTAVGQYEYRRGDGSVRFTAVELQDVNGNKQYNFDMGDTVRAKMSYKVFCEMRGIVISFSLRSGINGEIVTSVKHLVSSQSISQGTEGTAIIELPEVYIRPGEYPLYIHISEAVYSRDKYDVLDGMTHPLVITTNKNKKYSDFNPSKPLGYFSLPSQLIYNKNSSN